MRKGAISSVGRAIRLHRKGHRFESCIAHKKDRAPDHVSGALSFCSAGQGEKTSVAGPARRRDDTSRAEKLFGATATKSVLGRVFGSAPVKTKEPRSGLFCLLKRCYSCVGAASASARTSPSAAASSFDSSVIEPPITRVRRSCRRASRATFSRMK